MKLKYQMRGLGIGIVVTALLMGVATKDSLPLSDAEIKAKALTLGMVESDSLKLSDIQNTAHPSDTTAEPVEGEGNSSGGKVPGDSEMDPEGASGDVLGSGSGAPDESDPADGVADSEEASGGEVVSANGNGESGGESQAGGEDLDTGSVGEPEKEASDSGTTEDGTVTIHIESGMSSYRVSVIIAEAGLVEDASAFDRYLCAESYSRKIVDGTYKIPSDATEEEIAKIITRSR